MAPADDIGEQVLRFRDGDPAAAEQLAWRACRLALRMEIPRHLRNVTIAWIDSDGRVHGPGVFVPGTIGYGGGPIGPERPH